MTMFKLRSEVFFMEQMVKKEGEHAISKIPRKTKEEIEAAKQLKIKQKEEEEQSRWRWLGKCCSFHLVLTWIHPHYPHTIKHKTTLEKQSTANFTLPKYTLIFS